MLFRPYQPKDAAHMLAIYNDVIKSSTAIYMDEPVDIDYIHAMVQSRADQNYPVLVAVDDDVCVGFATYSDFRPRTGYRFTVEHSVHIAKSHRGCGIGSRLLRALLPLARDGGKHVMVGAIDGENTGSLHFHEKLGFVEVARMPQIGRKFDRWLDVVFMQIMLDDMPS